MDNFCSKCKVSVDELIANCPLCGKCINEKQKTVVSTATSTYPNIQIKNTQKFPVRIITFALMLLTLIFIALEFFILKTFNMSFYAIASFIFLYFSILIPAKHNLGFSASCICLFIGAQLLILFIELYSHTLGWGVSYVMPFISLACSICNGVLIVSKGYFNFEYYLPVLLSALASTALLIINFVYSWTWWPSASAFLFAWLVIFLVTFIKFKRFKKAMHKKFHF